MRFSFGVAAIGLTLAACSSSDSNAPGGAAPLTQADAQAIGEEMQTEVAGLSDGASLNNFLTPSFSAPPGAVRAFHGAFHGPVFFTPRSAGCPALSENPPTDTDGDGVPDNLTLTFDPATCTFTRPGGHASLELSGAITVSDPSTVGKGLRLAFATFQQKFTIEDSIFFQRSVDGVWQLTSDSSGFAATDSTTVLNTSSQRPSSELAKAWQVTFGADSGSTFGPCLRLPSGDFIINGTTTRTHDTVTRSFSVTTVAPLHRDVTCDAESKIVSGELDVIHTDSAGTATVHITYNGCGQDPTIALVT
jgi:hypothetical protein